MENLLSIINLGVAHLPEIITAIIGLLTGIIGICLLIPGEQPEKALQAVVTFISQFSKKP